MLQLKAKPFDICQVSKILAKYKIIASITNQVITLDGEFPDELLNDLCTYIDICTVQNFSSDMSREETTIEESEVPDIELTRMDNIYTSDNRNIVSQFTEKYDLIYPVVKRGEVYYCDLGTPYGSEQGYERYVIVVQNEIGNLHSPTTIILPFTTKPKNTIPTHYTFTLSKENIVYCNFTRNDLVQNTVEAEQIRTIDKTRLRNLVGMMTPEFMDKIDEIMKISLSIKNTVKTIVKTVTQTEYVDKIIYRGAPIEKKLQPRDISITQIQLLSYVNIQKLIEISKSSDSDKNKAENILILFGFDLKKNGIEYLLKAILISPRNAYFNLETLTESISKSEHIDQSEIKRLIVARIKEQFSFKKAPTIDFIRLINTFLKKENCNNEENDF